MSGLSPLQVVKRKSDFTSVRSPFDPQRKSRRFIENLAFDALKVDELSEHNLVRLGAASIRRLPRDKAFL
jgi:hypothetical protein